MTDPQCRTLLEDITRSCYVLEIYEGGPTIQCVSQALMDEARGEFHIETPPLTPLYESREAYETARANEHF